MPTRTQATPQAPAPRIHECGGLQSLRFDTEAGGRWACGPHTSPTLVIVTRGRVEVSGKGLERCSVRRGRMILVPEEAEFRLRAYGITRALVCRFYSNCTTLQPHFYRTGKWQAVSFSDEIRTLADLTEVMLRTDITISKPESFVRKGLWLQELLRRQCYVLSPTLDSSFADLDDFLEFKRKANRNYQEWMNSAPTRELVNKIARKII